MTYDKLLAKLKWLDVSNVEGYKTDNALRAVMELHEPINSIRGIVCRHCFTDTLHSTEFYPCPTIQAIERELS